MRPQRHKAPDSELNPTSFLTPDFSDLPLTVDFETQKGLNMRNTKHEWGHVIPTWSPPFAPGPYFMQSWEGTLVEFEVPRDQIDYLTPEPLQAASHNRLYAVIVDGCQPPAVLFYHEAVILQEVTFNGIRGYHIPYIWTSTDTAMLAGRELYGMPKLMCDDGKVQIFGNEVFGDLKRHGKTMMETAVIVDEKATLADFPDLSSWIMVRHIPSPDPNHPSRRQVLHVELKDVELLSAWKGRGWLKMGYPSSSGLHKLSTDNPIRGLYGKLQWILHEARVLEEIDYYPGKE